MKLSSGDGIACCLCASVHTQKFHYYSYDSYLRPANSTTSLFDQLGSAERSVDLCQGCHDNIVKHVLSNNSQIAKSKARPGSFCELTGQTINNVKYYLYKVTFVGVDLGNSDVKVDANYLHFFSVVNDLEQFAKP
jgi:hypothetical protein